MARFTMGRVLAATAVLGLTAVMSACSPEETPTPTPSATTTEIEPTDLPSAPTPTPTPVPVPNNLDGITATGGFGDKPDIEFTAPFAIDTTRTKILVQGTGLTVEDTGYVQVNYYGVDARSGDLFDQSYDSQPASFPLGGGVIPGFQKGLAGQKVGSRVLIAIPGVDGYDPNGGNEQAGIEVGDTLLFVVDILKASVTVPTGETVAVTDPNLPTVSGDVDKPVVTIPKATPPADLVVQPLIKGQGDPVTAEDAIRVNYAEYVWNTQTLVRQTFGFEPLMGQLSSTIPGWQQGLVGQTVGSRVMLIVPPSLAYPQGYQKLGIPEGSTMVYIIDIQFAAQS